MDRMILTEEEYAIALAQVTLSKLAEVDNDAGAVLTREGVDHAFNVAAKLSPADRLVLFLLFGTLEQIAEEEKSSHGQTS